MRFPVPARALIRADIGGRHRALEKPPEPLWTSRSARSLNTSTLETDPWHGTPPRPDARQPILCSTPVVRDPAEFSDRGFSPEEEEEWIAAVFWAESAEGWRDAGFKPEEAHLWAETGFEPQAAARWRTLLTPLSKKLKGSGSDEHADWHTWREVNAAAANWHHDGFSVADTERWVKAGFHLHDSKRAAGYRAEGITPDEVRTPPGDQPTPAP